MRGREHGEDGERRRVPASAPCWVKDGGAGLVGFHTRHGPWEAVTSAVVKVDWDSALPPGGQCSGMNGSSVFSQRSLLGDIWEMAFLREGVCSVWREEQCWRLVSGPTLRFAGAVGVVAVAVFLQTGGFQKLCRGAGGVRGTQRRHAGGNAAASLLHAERAPPLPVLDTQESGNV